MRSASRGTVAARERGPENAGAAAAIASSSLHIAVVDRTGDQLGAWSSVPGAAIAAWLVGLVTPGAPAGLGVREAVMLLILGVWVPQADLVVMNPTHYAVALKYEEGKMAAPKVVAKGADLLAMKIRDLAKESKVPVLQQPVLAVNPKALAQADGQTVVWRVRAEPAAGGAASAVAPAVVVNG